MAMDAHLSGSLHPSDHTAVEGAALGAVKSRVVVHLATGDVEVLTLADGTLLVDGDCVDPIAMTKSGSMKE